MIKYGIPTGFNPKDYHRSLDEILAKVDESEDGRRLYIKLRTMPSLSQLDTKMTI